LSILGLRAGSIVLIRSTLLLISQLEKLEQKLTGKILCMPCHSLPSLEWLLCQELYVHFFFVIDIANQHI